MDENSGLVYELFSVMIHSGSASGGHYYAMIKNLETKAWYCFNDTQVSEVSQRLFRIQDLCADDEQLFSPYLTRLKPTFCLRVNEKIA